MHFLYNLKNSLIKITIPLLFYLGRMQRIVNLAGYPAFFYRISGWSSESEKSFINLITFPLLSCPDTGADITALLFQELLKLGRLPLATAPVLHALGQ